MIYTCIIYITLYNIHNNESLNLLVNKKRYKHYIYESMGSNNNEMSYYKRVHLSQVAALKGGGNSRKNN